MNEACERQLNCLPKTSSRPSSDYLIVLSLVGDVVMIGLGLVLGFWVRFRSGWITFGVEANIQHFYDYASLICVGIIFLILAFGHLGLYAPGNLLRFRRAALIVVKSATFWLFAYLSISLVLKFEPPISRIYVVSSYILCLGAVLFWRMIFQKLLLRGNYAERLRQKVVFVGWNDEAERLANAVLSDPYHPYDVAGYISSRSRISTLDGFLNDDRENSTLLLTSVLERQGADIVILADSNAEASDIISLANLCERYFVQFKVIPSYFQILVSGLALETFSGVPILGVSELPLDHAMNRILKRTVDIIGSIAGMLMSTPIIILFGLIIYIESPGSIIFAQERVGRKGQRFKMYKLRSMKMGAETQDHLNQSTLRHDPRVLQVGKFMRQYNIDELPQFWNVFKGEMSLVGPRPERTYHSEKLSSEIPHYNARYSTKPGMTGWAQVNGLRGDTSLVERVQYDLFYLENWSLWLDFQILLLTFINRKNAY